ncbi:MAG: hypothetical protein C0395_09895, partial [Gemmatimonas sp.]|nr:hypothetical protein [Gemmatimonas sp.]
VAMNEDDLRRLVKEALGRYNQPVLVEQYVTGREFTVALMQTETQLRVLPPLEVVFLNQALRYPVYSFEIKQDWDSNVRYDCPALIDKRMERLLGAVSRKAFQALGCRDYARVDFRVSAQGVPYVLEVNPLPGLTPNFSDMCMIAKAAGISYDDLIGLIVKFAIRRMRVRGQKPRPPTVVRTVPAPAPAAAAPAAAAAAAAAGPAVDGTTRLAAAASAIPFLDLEPLPDFSLQGPVEVEPLRSIRRKVARKMTTSMILVPHVAHMDDADVTELEEFRLKMKARRDGEPGGKLTLLSFVIRAITAGLRAAPAFNASLDPFREEIVYKKYYNIGFAADTGKGLVVPVIRGTDVKSIREISREIEEKAALAREGKLPLEDMQGGTFTITNVGPLGGTALIPTINYPEVAILGMGRVQEKPVVRDGQIVIRKILPLTLAFDHRVADGADAARFVGELVRNLSDPNLLLLDT